MGHCFRRKEYRNWRSSLPYGSTAFVCGFCAIWEIPCAKQEN
nr:MAG TPA: hypothetical protein [Caudoviricetes sp.]